jgi:hypothetical protein
MRQEMKRFEYNIIRFNPINLIEADIQIELNEWGKVGWEIIYVGNGVMLLKREIGKEDRHIIDECGGNNDT